MLLCRPSTLRHALSLHGCAGRGRLQRTAQALPGPGWRGIRLCHTCQHLQGVLLPTTLQAFNSHPHGSRHPNVRLFLLFSLSFTPPFLPSNCSPCVPSQRAHAACVLLMLGFVPLLIACAYAGLIACACAGARTRARACMHVCAQTRSRQFALYAAVSVAQLRAACAAGISALTSLSTWLWEPASWPPTAGSTKSRASGSRRSSHLPSSPVSLWPAAALSCMLLVCSSSSC